MSGFRKFRSSAQRRRRSVEAAELGYLPGQLRRKHAGASAAPGAEAPSSKEIFDAAGTPADFPASREAIEIGPPPIAWLKARKKETDN